MRNDEHDTKKFWHYFLSNYIFNDKETWVVATEQPPVNHHSRRRIDLTVEKFSMDEGTLTLVMTGEGKKARASPSDITEVETQAYTSCTEYMLAPENEGRQWVWTMTFFGCEARIWACNISLGMLEPFYPRIYEFGQKTYYEDIEQSLDGFLAAFDYIKQHPVPTDDMFRNDATMDSGEGAAAEALDHAAKQAVTLMGTDPGPASMTMNVIDPQRCTLLKVKEITKHHVKGKREDGESVKSPALENWRAATVFVAEKNAYYECFTATATSGTQYWTWTLDVDQANDKGRQRKRN